jgi:hypothetical protein
MHVTNLTTSLTDPSFEPETREERMVQGGLPRYHTRQQKLADRGTAALLACVGRREGDGRSSKTCCSRLAPVHYPQL